jgi:hypothetical protein
MKKDSADASRRSPHNAPLSSKFEALLFPSFKAAQRSFTAGITTLLWGGPPSRSAHKKSTIYITKFEFSDQILAFVSFTLLCTRSVGCVLKRAPGAVAGR